MAGRPFDERAREGGERERGEELVDWSRHAGDGAKKRREGEGKGGMRFEFGFKGKKQRRKNHPKLGEL